MDLPEIDVEVLTSNPAIISAQRIAHRVTLVTGLTSCTSTCGDCGANQLPTNEGFYFCADCGVSFTWIALTGSVESFERDEKRLMAAMNGISHLRFVGYSTGRRAKYDGNEYAYFGRMA
jgi:hypothetical protein